MSGLKTKPSSETDPTRKASIKSLLSKHALETSMHGILRIASQTLVVRKLVWVVLVGASFGKNHALPSSRLRRPSVTPTFRVMMPVKKNQNLKKKVFTTKESS